MPSEAQQARRTADLASQGVLSDTKRVEDRGGENDRSHGGPNDGQCDANRSALDRLAAGPLHVSVHRNAIAAESKPVGLIRASTAGSTSRCGSTGRDFRRAVALALKTAKRLEERNC